MFMCKSKFLDTLTIGSQNGKPVIKYSHSCYFGYIANQINFPVGTVEDVCVLQYI